MIFLMVNPDFSWPYEMQNSFAATLATSVKSIIRRLFQGGRCDGQETGTDAVDHFRVM